MEISNKRSYMQHQPMHEQIKWRAYYFLEHKQAGTGGPNLDDELKNEWPRIVYALSRAQECRVTADANENRACRADRIYLRALSTFLTEFQLEERKEQSPTGQTEDWY